MYFYAHYRAVLAFALAGALLSSCSSVSYQTEEWRMAVPEQGDARAVVRYIGVGTNTKDPAAREKMAEKIKLLAEEKRPSKGFAPTLRNVRRRVYMEGDKLVLEETGTLPNPLSWQEQSGLNPLDWFSSGPALVTKGDYILKRDIDSTHNVIASDGKVMDEDTYTRSLRDKKPLGISTDTSWQRPSEQPVPDETSMQPAEVIVWPRQARTFYWKVSGKGFKQSWQSLAHEYENVAAVETVLPVTVARTSATNAPALTEDVITLDELIAPVATDDTEPIKGVEQEEQGGSATAATVTPAEPAADTVTPAEPATDTVTPADPVTEPETPAEPKAAVADAADHADAGTKETEQPAATPVVAPAPAVPKTAPPAAAPDEEDFPDATPVTPVSDDDTIK